MYLISPQTLLEVDADMLTESCRCHASCVCDYDELVLDLYA